MSGAGPSALVADFNELLVRLEKLGLSLIWTVLGEKRILGGRMTDQAAGRTFSQIARLSSDGSVVAGDRVFFDDYDEDVGPNPDCQPT